MKWTVTLVLAMLVIAGQTPAQMDDYPGLMLEPVFYELAESVETVRLENGLQVVLMPNPAQPMVGAYCVVGVGSAREDFSTSGMSHMLEHLLFNGTEEFETQEELYDAADRIGAYNNAHTTDFYTDYMMVVPAADLEEGLRIQSQMLFHSRVPEDKFEKEKGIVLGELVAARDDQSRQASEALRLALFEGTSLELPTLGTRATIAYMDRDDVYAFYRRWYVPNNMILTLAGNFDRDGALALLEKYYGEIAPQPLPDTRLRIAEPLTHTRTVVRRAGRERRLALAFEAPAYGEPGFFSFQVATSLLTAPGTGVLTRALDGLETDVRPEVDAWWQAAPGFSRLVLEFVLPEEFAADDGYRLVQEAVTAALEFGITETDVAGVVHMRELETLLDREQLRMTGIMIAEDLALGGTDFFLSYLERLRAVSPENVATMLRTYLVDRPCLAVLLEPRAEDAAAEDEPGMPGMPEGMKMPPAMAEALARMQAEQAGEPSDVSAEDDGAGYQPPGGGRPAVPVDRSVLENGATLISQTVPGSELMAVHLTVRGRARIDREYGEPGALNLVHRLLTTGISGCDEACLARRLRELGAKVKLVDNPAFPMDDYYTSGRFSFIRVETTAGSGPQMLELLVQMTRHGTFTGEDFERERRDQTTLLERDETSVSARAGRLLDEALYGDHPLVLPPEGTPESLDRVSFGQVRDVYRKAFAPENLIWSVVSPLPHAELKSLVERLESGRAEPTEGLPPLPATTAPRRITETMGGEMAAIRLGNVKMIDPDDAAAIELLVAVFSDRLQMDLRESRGLSYSVGAGVGIHGGEAVFAARLNPPRERLAEGESALTEAVRDFDAESISQEELDKIRSARRGRAMLRRISAMSRAYYLAMAELDGDVGAALRAVGAMDRVTLEDLRRVAATYFSEMPLVTVVVD